MALRRDLKIDQGATLRRTFGWREPLVVDGAVQYDNDGQVVPGPPIDLTGYTARLQIRKNVSDPEVMLELSTENEGIAIDGPAGDVTIHARPEQTSSLLSSGVWSLELASPDGDVYRIIEGRVRLSQEVTR